MLRALPALFGMAEHNVADVVFMGGMCNNCSQHPAVVSLTRSALGRAHLPLTTVFRCLNTTRCCFDGPPIPVRAWDFPDVIKFYCCSAYAMWERNPVPASGLWSRSGSKVNKFVHVPTSVDKQHSSKSMHVFLSNLAHQQTDRQTNELGRVDENIYLLRCRR